MTYAILWGCGVLVAVGILSQLAEKGDVVEKPLVFWFAFFWPATVLVLVGIVIGLVITKRKGEA